MDDIDATDAQRATFDAAAKSILAEAQALKKSHHRHKKEMLTLLSNPTPDREEIKLHIQEKIDGLEEFALRNVDKILDAYETLDAAQRQIILDKLAKHMEKH
jgi:Spy/CpxP family protein refolding chaperone